MSINKIPFTGIYGITSLSDGSNFASAILSGATPLSAQPSSGGYSGIYYIATGGISKLIDLFAGPPTPDQMEKNSMWVVEFGVADIGFNELFTDPGVFACKLTNAGGQNIGSLFTNTRYLFDTAAVCELDINNLFLTNQLSIKVWELYQQ